ncbi:hypothetical protein C6P52_07950 [Enterococcus mundtii]|uniref:amidase family protein n=1 Tax=Enterococcus mundtii TaxID=53346 RepID=UPI000D3909B3|nr:amidase family protein [Enterococcus mundtii]PTO38650.1 hypothetical protein C6P52_07950 [Enterococcus mundtii]PTO41506.1 hypothetical protein C6P54_13350 [Enterococcus mundtii]
MDFKRVQKYSKKTSIAMANYFHSVTKVFPNCIVKINSQNDYYVGVKNVPLISESFLKHLDHNGFHLHTIDKASHKGRGIDIDLKNPITGRFMSGSSSGTAINVFYGINDIGVGTDGGGSVLSPAASLNLVGMIHPNFGSEWIDYTKYSKTSTDGIVFSPSIGFISKDLKLVEQVASLFIKVSSKERRLKVALDSDIEENNCLSFFQDMIVESKNLSYKYETSRPTLIKKLESLLSDFDIIISNEGPIDVYGIGETIFGHFDDLTKEIQIKGNKGFLRVVNMCNAIGLIVPSTKLATGYLIIGREYNFIEKYMFDIAEKLITDKDPLMENYFLDHSSYFEEGYIN